MYLRRTYRFIFSLLTVVAVATAQAQDAATVAADTTPRPRRMKPTDTIPYPYRPTGIRFGTDLISLIKSQTTTHWNGWEVNGDLDFYRYFLAVDYGSWSRNDNITNGTYKNNGTYYRIGTDINFLLKDPDRNMFFIGFRYGHSSYDESVAYSLVDSAYGAAPKDISVSGRSAHWLELTTGLRVKIVSGLWLGYTARMKFSPHASDVPGLKPFDIPGYGLAERKPYWGINYQIFWRIPLPKKEVPPKKE